MAKNKYIGQFIKALDLYAENIPNDLIETSKGAVKAIQKCLTENLTERFLDYKRVVTETIINERFIFLMKK